MGKLIEQSFEECKFLTAEMIAEYVGVSKITVYRHMESGKLPHYRLGSMRKVSKADFYEWLESLKVQGQKRA